MRRSKFFRRFSTHIVALVFGCAITFGAMQGSSEPINQTLADTATPQQVAAVPITGERSFVAEAVERTGAAVVRLDTEKTVVRRFQDPFMNDPFFREFFGDRFGNFPSEQEQVVTGQGSGFITDGSGTILTNAHVVSGADKVTVTFKDGRSFEGEVKGTDEITDLAVVKINPGNESIPVAPLGNSGNVQVGDWAIAVGNPVGLNNTVTLGIISTLERSSAQAGIPDKRVDFLQTDAAINPGNSGGPLLNAKGEVIGINTAIRRDAMGIGFAIPINKAKSLQDTLASGKEVPHPFIGIRMVTITPDEAKQNNSDPNSLVTLPEVEGVLVIGVLPNSPAQEAGLRRGDVITKIDGKRIVNAPQLQEAVEDSGINATLKVELTRGDRQLQVNIKTAQLSEMS
ncbi:HhoA/HhoB/HtrA family serine endopeptidase [[Limnothrix rosea] IAM M-220]|uniref:HhoA/HhoB/HtrA family serine endopeptidase n=1 Tax=[Limnothrix rosea] IAM M-220 TaxID=454133 RepID=UPI00095FF5E1|nr:HhoA/HhoB/HtrA family serine endopeptidase [[Limnothrix rosea] IAM M-220]OKH18558.1 serine protease [[Limnothrix rosea] IAM M-220]